MDGYVCHDAELAGAGPDHPVRLRVSGQVRMGDPPAAGPNPGEAWAITTGGAMPLRGDRVVPLESVRRSGDEVVLTHPPKEKRHVADPGEDVPDGACLIREGEVVGTAMLGALIACAVDAIPAYRQPGVALLATGDELVEFTESSTPPVGRIFNTNAAVLLNELRDVGCHVTYCGIVRDQREALRAAFDDAVRAGHDVVLTTGGVSVGPHDRVPRTWLDLGAERIVGRIDLKPGGPFFAGRLGSTWVMGLSGGPAACLTAYHLLVRPLLLRLAGRKWVVRPIVPVRLADAQRYGTDRMRALWARASHGDAPRAEVLTGTALGTLGGIAQANGLILLPPGTPPLRAGSRVAMLFLDRPEDRNHLAVPPAQAAPLVVGIVGRAEGGKTMIVSGLLSRLRAAGLRVLAIKHAAHGFAIDHPGSDSARMFDAGAEAVMVVGPAETVLRFSTGREVTADAALDLAIASAERLAGRPPHLVLVEGFRHPGRPVVQVGPPKTDDATGDGAWATVSAVRDMGPEALDTLLNGLAAALQRWVEGEDAWSSSAVAEHRNSAERRDLGLAESEGLVARGDEGSRG